MLMRSQMPPHLRTPPHPLRNTTAPKSKITVRKRRLRLHRRLRLRWCRRHARDRGATRHRYGGRNSNRSSGGGDGSGGGGGDGDRGGGGDWGNGFLGAAVVLVDFQGVDEPIRRGEGRGGSLDIVFADGVLGGAGATGPDVAGPVAAEGDVEDLG